MTHLRHPTKPRPGSEPGPLSTTRTTQSDGVPGQARHGFAVLLTLILTTPTLAQVIPTGTPAADILLSQAIADQRLFLTCSALEPDTHTFLLEAWQRDIAKATDLLTAAKVAPEAITAFTTAAAPESLLPAPDTSFEDLQKFCATDPKWLTRAMRLDTVRLAEDLPKVLP
jgi:hypothetical protein